MGTLDIILLCCFIPAVVTGILKGFIEQATNLVAIICSAWAAFKFATLLADWMAGFLTVDEKLLRIIAFIIIVILVAILLISLGKLISKALGALSLGWLDRLLGLIFSLFKALLIIGTIIFLLEGLNEQWHIFNPDSVNDSIVYSAIREAAGKILPFLKSLIANV